MTGLAIGLAIGRDIAMLLLIPLAFAMIFMVTAWTYCLRGWLAAMMTNPRRRRAVIMGITLAFILLAQGRIFISTCSTAPIRTTTDQKLWTT